MKTKTPLFNGVSGVDQTLPYYSDHSPLCEFDWIRLRLVALTPPRSNEPRLVSSDRARIASAIYTKDHLQRSGFPPIFPSFEYECLQLIGVL